MSIGDRTNVGKHIAMDSYSYFSRAMGDQSGLNTLERADSLDERSEENSSLAQECYNAYVNKINDNMYKTKGLGFIPGMDASFKK